MQTPAARDVSSGARDSRRLLGWASSRSSLGYAYRVAWRPLVQGIVAGLLWRGAQILVPFFTQQAIDEGLIAGSSGRLGIWTAALLLAGLVVAALAWARHRNAEAASEGSDMALRQRTMGHVLYLDGSFYQRVHQGDVLARVTSDTRWVSVFVDGTITWIAATVAIATVVGLVLWLDLLLGLLALAVVPLMLALNGLMARSYNARSLAVQGSVGRLTAVMHETISGIRVVKGLGAEGRQRQQFDESSDGILRQSLQLARLGAVLDAFAGLVPGLALVAGLWWGGVMALEGRFSIGQILAFAGWMVVLLDATEIFAQRLQLFLRARASASRVDDLIRQQAAVLDPDSPACVPENGRDSPTEVRFERVQIRLNGRPLLDAVDLTVHAGESVAIVGVSGAGKSLLLSLMLRMRDPDAGRILLNGVDIRDLALAQLRRAVVLVPHDVVLFRDTVAANIALGRPKATLEEIEQAARLAHAHEFISKLAQGYDTVLEERGYSLSGGQRQRIALAQAILARPRVLLLDDAISAVDAATAQAIAGGMVTAMQRQTSIVVSHRRSILALAQRVVVLEDGRVAAEGTDSDLWRHEPRYRALLGSQSS
jgi:ATP-binding cassette subfamily B protein